MMDQILEQAVLSVLYTEPSIDVHRVLATVCDGITVVSGDVDTGAQKAAAELKVKGVPGIRGVVDDLEVCPAGMSRRRYAEIADDVLNALFWDLAVPSDRVSAKCDRGWVTLTGEVDQPYQKTSAEADVRRTAGVVGVTNQIRVEPNMTTAATRGDELTPNTVEFRRPSPVIAKSRGAAIRGLLDAHSPPRLRRRV